MGKFKKGDVVRIINPAPAGDIAYTIIAVGDSRYPYQLRPTTRPRINAWSDEELELVTDSQDSPRDTYGKAIKIPHVQHDIKHKENKNMSKKFYRVTQDTFMWSKGAILEHNGEKGSTGGYEAISDLWDKVELEGEYISARIVEHPDNADVFERVYEMDRLGKMVYMTKEAAQQALGKFFKGTETNDKKEQK